MIVDYHKWNNKKIEKKERKYLHTLNRVLVMLKQEANNKFLLKLLLREIVR